MQHFLINSHPNHISHWEYLYFILPQNKHIIPNLIYLWLVFIHWRIICPQYWKHKVLLYLFLLIKHMILCVIKCQKLRYVHILSRFIKHTKISLIMWGYLNWCVLIVSSYYPNKFHSWDNQSISNEWNFPYKWVKVRDNHMKLEWVCWVLYWFCNCL